MKNAKHAVVDYDDDYNDAVCDQCGSGDRDHQLLLCDKCDKAYHMLCLRPIVVRVPIGPWFCRDCSDHPPSPPVKSINSLINMYIYIHTYIVCIYLHDL